MAPGTQFQPVLSTLGEADPSRAERVIFVAGKLYYDLAKEVAARELKDRVVLIRLEELCPFPFAELESALKPFAQNGRAPQLVWVQEEPRNQGAWGHVHERLKVVIEKAMGNGQAVEYRGRPESAVPATGVGRWHAAEHSKLVNGAFEGL